MKILQYIVQYCKTAKYGNYSTTTLNIIQLPLLANVLNRYLVLTLNFICHSSLSIDFSQEGQFTPHSPRALTRRHIANCHNAPILVIMAVTC